MEGERGIGEEREIEVERGKVCRENGRERVG
jgi:hypothetical protein